MKARSRLQRIGQELFAGALRRLDQRQVDQVALRVAAAEAVRHRRGSAQQLGTASAKSPSPNAVIARVAGEAHLAQ